jgi:hypothetical protein
MADEKAGDRTGGWRRVVAWATTGLAFLLVQFVLTVPPDFTRITLQAFLRIPVEGLVGVVLLLVLPPRARRIVALLGGVALGLLGIVKVMDMGVDAVFYRPFDLVLDWPLLRPGIDYLEVTVGRVGAIGVEIAAGLLVVALIVLTTLSVLRLTRVVAGHRLAATRAVVLLSVAWIALGVPGVPVTSDSAAAFAYTHARQVKVGLHDQEVFAEEARVDAFRDTPAEDLLTGLRGKDVVISFVESYGRVAVEHPELAPRVDAVLDDGTRRLNAAGFASRSAYLTSPTAGGGSWMAQATLLSGLWIDNQQRYRNLVTSDRLSLPSAFRKADWRSVGVMPGITQAWPEGAFFNYDKIYAAADLGYQGPRFGYSTMPDQYTLSAFEKSEHAKPGHAPVMAAIPLVTSHAPWPTAPRQVDWKDVGDGSIYKGMPASSDDRMESIFDRSPTEVRADYGRSIEYSLSSLISYVETHGDDNLVLVFLGDHQPAQFITGEGAGHDVPITIVARDPAMLDRVAGWGWNDGLRPAADAPVWKMSAFRDKFLTAFGPPDAPTPTTQTPPPPVH